MSGHLGGVAPTMTDAHLVPQPRNVPIRCSPMPQDRKHLHDSVAATPTTSTRVVYELTA